MLDMIATGLTALSTARDLAKGIAGLREDIAVQMKAAELLTIIADAQGSLIEAQAKIFELQSDLRLAKEQLAKQADFDRYRLCEPYRGTYLWKLRDDMRDPDEPSHYVCPVCKEDGTLSHLSGPDDYSTSVECPRCKRSFSVRETAPRSLYD
ncbi:hypothetical protein dqs_0615 [Azoarcus olearius]|uniref:hypothetical protein n=1 Tax=Azoarcus sp. (strain BH72) TaxID=418699 RepID=UPI0008060AC7|nr:hypothetical protein [Azoarcus olearius]ANQ83691.1 hypothetical protein dqs_0615 [Azoarcus olearius]